MKCNNMTKKCLTVRKSPRFRHPHPGHHRRAAERERGQREGLLVEVAAEVGKTLCHDVTSKF